MTHKIGDLLPAGDPYLQDERFALVLDSQDLEWMWRGRDGDVPSGALVDVDETWITVYQRPFDLASVYERIE